MTMDFLESLENLLAKQNYYSSDFPPTLTNGNSISLMIMPSNDYDHYYDGSYRQGYAFQIMTKHMNMLTAYHTLINISKLLTEIPDIPSMNGSFQFEGIEITTDPNGIGKDDKYYIYAAQFKAALFITNRE